MNKQKLFSVLSLMGLVFMIGLSIWYVQAMNTRGAVIEHKVEISDQFARYFSRVTTKNRLSPIPKAQFHSPDGKTVSWHDFGGNYLLVNFWATWCAPCVIELPSLEKLRKKFTGQGLEVISISLDTNRSQDDIKEFLYNRNIGEFAAYWDFNREIHKNIQMRGIPTTYLLDPKGNILHIFEGDANWNAPSAIAFFSDLLNREK